MRYIPIGDVRGPSLGYQTRRRPPAPQPLPVARAVLALFVLLLLSGCGPGYTRAHDCRVAAGPEPYATGNLFGLAGAVFMAAQTEHQQWTDSIDACMARTKPVAPAAP